jgi:hypothetical protein
MQDSALFFDLFVQTGKIAEKLIQKLKKLSITLTLFNGLKRGKTGLFLPSGGGMLLLPRNCIRGLIPLISALKSN